MSVVYEFTLKEKYIFSKCLNLILGNSDTPSTPHLKALMSPIVHYSGQGRNSNFEKYHYLLRTTHVHNAKATMHFYAPWCTQKPFSIDF